MSKRCCHLKENKGETEKKKDSSCPDALLSATVSPTVGAVSLASEGQVGGGVCDAPAWDGGRLPYQAVQGPVPGGSQSPHWGAEG